MSSSVSCVLTYAQLGGREVSGADVLGGVPDRIVEAGQKAAAAEGVDVLAHDVALAAAPGDVADVEVAGLAGPQREAVVVLRGEHGVLHLGGDGGVGPLAGIEAGRVEQLDVQVRLRPRAGVGEDPEVQEHAEAQVDEVALQLFQRLGRARRRCSRGGGDRRLAVADAAGRRNSASARDSIDRRAPAVIDGRPARIRARECTLLRAARGEYMEVASQRRARRGNIAALRGGSRASITRSSSLVVGRRRSRAPRGPGPVTDSGPAPRQRPAGARTAPRSRRRRLPEAGGLRRRRRPRRVRQGPVVLRPQEPGGAAEAVRRREVRLDPGRAARRRSPRRSCARASTSAPAGCRSSTRPARPSSRRRTAAGRVMPAIVRARTRSTCGRSGSPTPTRRSTASARTSSASSTSRATTSISGSTTARIVVPFLVSSRGWGVLWDNTSFTRFGDLRELEPIPADRLIDANGKRGGLTGQYYSGADFKHLVGERVDRVIDIQLSSKEKKPNTLIYAGLPEGQRQRALGGRGRAGGHRRLHVPDLLEQRHQAVDRRQAGHQPLAPGVAAVEGRRQGAPRGRAPPQAPARVEQGPEHGDGAAPLEAAVAGRRDARRRPRSGRRSATASTTTSSTVPSWTRSSPATGASPGRRR